MSVDRVNPSFGAIRFTKKGEKAFSKFCRECSKLVKNSDAQRSIHPEQILYNLEKEHVGIKPDIIIDTHNFAKGFFKRLFKKKELCLSIEEAGMKQKINPGFLKGFSEVIPQSKVPEQKMTISFLFNEQLSEFCKVIKSLTKTKQ